MALEIRPIAFRDAQEYVRKYHRHNDAPRGGKYSVACYDDGRLCGVAICGRPVSRMLDDGITLEIYRVCTDGTHNACSCLYGAARRTAKAMGYKRIITYTLLTEPGTSLLASGFHSTGVTSGGEWTRENRKRRSQAVYALRKVRWEWKEK